MFSRTIIAALFAALPAVNAVGQAVVQNHCDTTVNLWSVSSEFGDGAMHSIAPGGTYVETYKQLSTGGVSIKMTHKPSLYEADASIAQFEYTLAGNIWYDISLINGNPFWRKGMQIVPSDGSCPTKNCPAGQESCSDAYMVWNDDHATAACSADSDITFNLCSGTGVTRRDAEPQNATEIDARDAAPEPEPTVADIHESMRKRSSHRHHFHRRSADMQ